LDTNASPEGFVGFNLVGAAMKLRFFSTEHLKDSLVILEERGVIAEVAYGKENVGLKMMLPEGKYREHKKAEEPGLFGDTDGTVWQAILDYWNRLATDHPDRLVKSRSGKPTAPQVEALKRAWRNEDFRRGWRRSIRILVVSSYYHGTKVGFTTWSGKAKNTSNLWALQSMVIFDEQAPSLTEANHLVLYPKPSSWHDDEDPGPWANLYPTQREAIYRNLETLSKEAI
jgi:hypothetical protein